MARAHALLMATEDPLSLDEIAGKLQISNGNASISLRELRTFGVVRQIEVSADRRDFYVTEPDVWTMFFRAPRVPTAVEKALVFGLAGMIVGTSTALIIWWKSAPTNIQAPPPSPPTTNLRSRRSVNCFCLAWSFSISYQREHLRRQTRQDAQVLAHARVGDAEGPAAVPCFSRAAWSCLARTTGFGSGFPGTTGSSSPTATRSYGTTTRIGRSRSVRDLSGLGSIWTGGSARAGPPVVFGGAVPGSEGARILWVLRSRPGPPQRGDAQTRVPAAESRRR